MFDKKNAESYLLITRDGSNEGGGGSGGSMVLGKLPVSGRPTNLD